MNGLEKKKIYIYIFYIKTYSINANGLVSSKCLLSILL